MESSAALIADITNLCETADNDPSQLLDLVDLLWRDLHLAVSSCLGFELVLLDYGHPTTLTWFHPSPPVGVIATSLHLPLVLLTSASAPPHLTPAAAGPADGLTLYAATPGAFVDLAADLTYMLRPPEPDISSAEPPGKMRVHAEGLRLDRDLTPTSVRSGLVSAEEVSTINRAVGWLIDKGHEPEAAYYELTRRAAAAGTTLLIFATELLRR